METGAVPKELKEARVGRDNNGQIAVGNVVYQIGSITGGQVNFILPEEQPTIEPRRLPVMIRPRRMSNLLDRHDEMRFVVEEITPGALLEFIGETGIGKSALLRGLAYHTAANTCPDGVIYMLGSDQPVEDLLQSLFDAFYQSNRPFKPSETQIRLALSDKRALILLDDLELDGSRVEALMDAAPNCTFVLASNRQHVWGEGSARPLSGLPEKEACQLFERELGRQTRPDEAPFVHLIYEALKGHPLRILQAASLAREHEHIDLLARYLSEGDPVDRLNHALVSGIKQEDKKRLLAVMAIIGIPAPASALGAWSGAINPLAALNTLTRQGLVQLSGSQFHLAQGVGMKLLSTLNAGAWREWALAALSKTLETAVPGTPDASAAVDAGLQMLRWLSGGGRWDGVIRLSRLLDPHLTLTRRWGAWQQVLHASLDAAQALEDLPARAWALHQIGTRELCLGNSSQARNLLIKALRLRRLLNDTRGEMVTRHNLSLLLGGPPNSGSRGGSPEPRPPARPPIKLTLPIAVVLAISAVITYFLVVPAQPPPPVTPAVTSMNGLIPGTGFSQTSTPTPTPTITLTASPTITTTPTPTATLTVTPTPTWKPTPCGPFPGWVQYRIRPGDTLYRLAGVTGTTVEQIMLANCLNSSMIYAGNMLWLPFIPVDPPTLTPTLTPTITLTESPVEGPYKDPYQDKSSDLVIDWISLDSKVGDGGAVVITGFQVSNVGSAPADWYISGKLHYEVVAPRSYTIYQPPLPAVSSGEIIFKVKYQLEPGESVNVTPQIDLDATWVNQSILVWAEVDACTTGSGMCQYPEINVQNNIASPKEMLLQGPIIIDLITITPPPIYQGY